MCIKLSYSVSLSQTEDCVKVQQDWYCPQVTLKFKYKKGEKD